MYNQDLSKLPLDTILIQPYDLPVGCEGGQIRDEAPEMFNKLPVAQKSAYQQIGMNNKQIGGVTVLMYDDVSTSKEVYSKIVSGFVKGDDDIWKISFQTSSTIGETSTIISATIKDSVDPYIRTLLHEGFTEIAFVSHLSVAHIRMIISDSDGVKSYAKRLENRINILMNEI